ncbi:MAG: hypothetical protein NTX15_09735 [Candidatus Kapabacteria bacterium]|nr:hypothetical protein [Candidatus Kapabacteria bacterium]
MNTKKHNGDVMNQTWMRSITVVMFLACTSAALIAGTAGTSTVVAKRADKGNESVQRTPRGTFDQQKNVVSNVDFQTTNYGIVGFDVANGVGGTFWPRGRRNQYIFAGGAWFGTRKRPPGSDSLRKRVMITYNPNSGRSWMVPGTIEDGALVNTSTDQGINKFRTYFSTDFSSNEGNDFQNPTFPRWPIWDTSPNDTIRYNNYYGDYVNDPTLRYKTNYTKGPAFISEEDVFCTYKDTDLNYYEGGTTKRKAEGFPLGMQVEQIIYSWGFGDYADFLFLKYLFIHPKKFGDTLFDCWMAAVQDVDVALQTNSSAGAQNDRAKYYDTDPTLNLAVQWSNADRGEAGQGFGYLGFNFLESPAIDADKFIRKDRKQFPLNEQLGLRTMRNWPITEDPIENEDRYNFISRGTFDTDNGPGDRRLMMATGPFNMRPGDSARIVVGIILAGTGLGGDATGTVEDMTELVRKVKFAQFVYDNQFRAPKPPETSTIKGAPKGSTTGVNSFMTIPPEGYLSLNNAIAIQWDSTSEMSVDTLERGLDFMGYRIYRARRTDQDTFAIDFQENARKGPLSWKQIAQFDVGTPFVKEGDAIGITGVRRDQLTIADVIKPGQKRFLVARTLNFNAPAWGNYYARLRNARGIPHADPRLGRVDPFFDVYLNTDSTVVTSGEKNGSPNFYKLDSVQFTYMTTLVETLPTVGRVPFQGRPGYLRLDSLPAKAAKDSLVKLILLRRVKMDPFLFPDVDTNYSAIGTPTYVRLQRPWEETNEVRRGIVARYIREQSAGRVFFDVGDDNGNGVVSYSTDPEASEKLINNIDYTYAVRAYDEGDYLLPTQSKLNSRAVGLPNVVTATPLAARPGKAVSFSFTTDDQTRKKLGGIYNVRLLVDDQQRFNQLFAGRTLELEFFRLWSGYNSVPSSTDPGDGLYGVVFLLRDSATRETLNQWNSFLPPELCPTSNVTGLPGYFSERSSVYVGVKPDSVFYDTVFTSSGKVERIDTTTFGRDDSREKVIRSGTYTSNAACFSEKYAFGALGIAFDYSIEQWGGLYRLDSGYTVSGPDNIYVGLGKSIASVYASDVLNPAPAYIQLPYPGFIPQFPWTVSYNNGPGIYEVTFKEGSTETLTTKFLLNSTTDAGKDSTMTFPNVPYLTYEIKNVYSFDRQDPQPDGTIGTAKVGYELAYQPQELDYNATPVDRKKDFPTVAEVRIGNFATAAYGWRNAHLDNWGAVALKPYAAESNTGNPLGKQLRYYRSRNVSTTGTDTLDFLHVITIAGCQFVVDFSRKGRKLSTTGAIPNPPSAGNHPDVLPNEDFKAGDKIRLTTFGGAFGFPFDSAKAYIRVAPYDAYTASTGSQSYSDKDLEQVQVVPNPFYVSQEGMSTPFQGQIYFTRLPRVCTIHIYSVSGALVQTINHNELTSPAPDKVAADVWTLLSKNKQRVASQMLIAKIETPEGASVIRKFSVVVGPARIIGDGE